MQDLITKLTSPELRPVVMGTIVGGIAKLGFDTHPAFAWAMGGIVAVATFVVQNKNALPIGAVSIGSLEGSQTTN